MKDAKGHGSDTRGAAHQSGVEGATTKTPVQEQAERMAKAYLAGDEAGARTILDERPLKTFEYVALTDTFRRLVGKK